MLYRTKVFVLYCTIVVAHTYGTKMCMIASKQHDVPEHSSQFFKHPPVTALKIIEVKLEIKSSN